MNERYDILVFMSDQHSGLFTGFGGDPVIRTPNLDRIAKDAAVFEQAYTPCPLCVPARAAFMTTRMASAVGVLGNEDAYSSDEPTFIHCLGAQGYETTLCGRMHFKGMDQRHGFDWRIAQDITPNLWGNMFTGGPVLEQDYTHADEMEIFAGEDNVAFQYDKYVVNHALNYLKGTYDKSQAIVVGTYMPHVPLGGFPEKVNYYKDKVLKTYHSYETAYPCDGFTRLKSYEKMKDKELLATLRAHYYAMVEEEDQIIGQVYDAFQEYLKRNNRKGIFVYLSDHGDQMGEKGLLGKNVFFEHASKIPMLIKVDGMAPSVVRTPVSLMDVGTTLCAMNGIEPVPGTDGVDLTPAIEGRAFTHPPVVSETFRRAADREIHMGLMVRDGHYKYITYTGYESQDMLFDLDKDPWEEINILAAQPKLLEKFKVLTKDYIAMAPIYLQEACRKTKNSRLLRQWGESRLYANESFLLL